MKSKITKEMKGWRKMTKRMLFHLIPIYIVRDETNKIIKISLKRPEGW
jgi:hypothetical protein